MTWKQPSDSALKNFASRCLSEAKEEHEVADENCKSHFDFVTAGHE